MEAESEAMFSMDSIGDGVCEINSVVFVKFLKVHNCALFGAGHRPFVAVLWMNKAGTRTRSQGRIAGAAGDAVGGDGWRAAG